MEWMDESWVESTNPQPYSQCKKIYSCSIFDDQGARTPLEARAQPTLTQPAHYLGCPSYIPPRRGAHLKGRHVMEAEECRLSLPRIYMYVNV